MAYVTKPRAVLEYELSLEPYHKSPLAVARHLETHYRFRDVAGDGNCLFRALSVGLYGHENEHTALRARAFAYLQTHPDVLANNKRGAAILATSDRHGAWGEHPHIVAIARELSARVVQWSVLTGQWFVSGEPETGAPTERVVWLRYVDNAHYGGYAYSGSVEERKSSYADMQSPPYDVDEASWYRPHIDTSFSSFHSSETEPIIDVMLDDEPPWCASAPCSQTPAPVTRLDTPQRALQAILALHSGI
jgi:hypothetical protein